MDPLIGGFRIHRRHFHTELLEMILLLVPVPTIGGRSVRSSEALRRTLTSREDITTITLDCRESLQGSLQKGSKPFAVAGLRPRRGRRRGRVRQCGRGVADDLQRVVDL